MSKSRKPDENAIVLKGKVRELEDEVSKLKQRLEDLRKAKNNTILKREREVVQVGGPNLGRPVGVETAKYKELERKLAESEKKATEFERKFESIQKALNQTEQDRDSWKEKHEMLQEEMKKSNDTWHTAVERHKAETREATARAEDLSIELERLREKLEVKAMQEENKKIENNEREIYITDLINENTSLRMKVETLFNELSVKEAKWLDGQEKMKRKVQERWDQKYAKWMKETERKIEELRAANFVLKQCLAKTDHHTQAEKEPTTSTSPSTPPHG